MSSGGRAPARCAAALFVACCAAHAGVDFRAEPASADARAVGRWALDGGDHEGLPFAIVDKRDARMFVFAADGRLLGATNALLGSAPGDDSAPGVGALEPSRIPPQQRTTPAGRFISEPGRNLTGEHIVWVDYDTGIAIHRLRPGASRESRERRLATPSAADNRVSLGCIVVPPAFYDTVVRPALGAQAGVVYVLPETRSVADWLEEMQAAF